MMPEPARATAKFESVIRAAIDKEVEEAKEQIVKDTVESFEKHIRKIVGAVAIDAANCFSVERSGTNLCIMVKYVTD